MLMIIVVAWTMTIKGIVTGRLQGGVVGPKGKLTLVVISIVLSILCVGFGVKRILDVKRILGIGPVVMGRIQNVHFVHDRGRVEYTYEHAGEAYESGTGIWKNRETKKLKTGDEIELIVDPDKPSRALVASLYVH